MKLVMQLPNIPHGAFLDTQKSPITPFGVIVLLVKLKLVNESLKSTARISFYMRDVFNCT